jgi:prolipoprotein diacylglyceryltransferase
LSTYYFHISFYGLAFLGAIFIGLTFAALLLLGKSVNHAPKRFLALALIVMILWMIRVLSVDIRESCRRTSSRLAH